MDTLHDIGGRQGFGAVRWQKDRAEKAFDEDWQGRAWAMCMLTFAGWRDKPEIWTLDWFRHVRERIEPVDFLTRDYYDQWVQSLAATLIDNGTITLQELVPGARSDPAWSAGSGTRPAAATATGDAREPVPLFKVGDRVSTKPSVEAFHTRLPGYVRGRTGVIEESHGSRPLADASAAGVIKPEPLYTVGFEAGELWPEAQGRRERVFVDAWESYLVRA
jgi:nitrile hydratase